MVVILLIVGVALLLLPPYANYCETDSANKFNCAAYEFIVAIVGAAQVYNGLITALATFAIAWFTWTIKGINREQVAHTRTIERAYVKLSHSAPGLDVQVNTGLIYIKMAVKNFGQTPADITNIFFKPVVISPMNAPLPKTPDYSGDAAVFPKAYLVRDEEFFIFHVLKISREEIISVKDWSAALYVIGFVDYIDKFGDRHRSGYARKYAAARDDRKSYETDEEFSQRNNLIFVTEAGYNYDRIRVAGDGDDWNGNS